MLRMPLSLNTHATAPPEGAAVRSLGNGAERACSIVNPAARTQAPETQKEATTTARRLTAIRTPKKSARTLTRRDQIQDRLSVGLQLDGPDARDAAEGLERARADGGDRRERAVVEDNVRRNGSLGGLAPPPDLQRLEQDVVRPVAFPERRDEVEP